MYSEEKNSLAYSLYGVLDIDNLILKSEIDLGKYFSPIGTAMKMRALPYDADLSQYRQFVVVKPFEVEASTIAPAFGKIGLGTQYRSSVSVEVLLKKGIIKKIGGN